MGTNNDLNSALALFRSLYQAQKGDIYTIIERFVLVGVKSNGMISFTIEEIAIKLKEMFNLDIPFIVIQKCIISHQTVFKYSRGRYVVINPMDEEIDRIIEEMNEIEDYKASVIHDLTLFIEENGIILTDNEKSKLGEQFFDFIIDQDHSKDNNRYKLHITRFIIEKENDNRFQRFLNSIREGMVIYKGIRYSDSPNDTTWESNTDFFLDQEYLFSACGMNGSYHEKCFFEFYNFMEEINKVSKYREKRDRIRLFYFSETKNDIDSYFSQAIRIRRMQERYTYPQVAMDNILSACKEDIDIERYKSNFYHKLKELRIVEYPDEIDIKRNPDFLFENSEFEREKDSRFSQDQLPEINYYVKIADYINILREGKRCTPLEKCRYMFLSDGNISNDLSRYIREFYSEKRPIVITRMGNFTELMWFKLKKGVVDSSSPASINVVNKAKTIVSGLLHDNLKKQYDAVLASNEDDNTKREFYAELRTKRYSPDDISSDTIAEDIAFINDVDYFDKYTQTQKLLKSQAAKSDSLEKALEDEIKKNEELENKVNSFKEYVKREDCRKKKLAIENARQKIRFIRFIYKNYAWFLNLVLLTAFVIPSCLYMPHNWVNMTTVFGTYIAVASVFNAFLNKSKDKILNKFFKQYRIVLTDEIRRQGLID